MKAKNATPTKKSNAPSQRTELNDRERRAVGALVKRCPVLDPPRFRQGKGKVMEPDAPTDSDSVFQARVAYATGTLNSELAVRLIQQAANIGRSSDEDPAKVANAAAAAISGIRPENELEGILAAQMVAGHSFAMELMQRATSAKYVDHVKIYGSLGAKFLRLFIDQTDALARMRGKTGRQTVRVEHVHVEPGAQAIVGNVTHGGEGDHKNRETTS